MNLEKFFNRKGDETLKLFEAEVIDSITYESSGNSFYPLKPNAINIVKVDYTFLNSNEYLVVPLESLFKYAIEAMDTNVKEALFQEYGMDGSHIDNQVILETLKSNADFIYVWSSIFRMFWSEIDLYAAKQNKTAYLYLGNENIFTGHIKNGLLSIFVDIFSFINNIVITHDNVSLKPLFKDREIINMKHFEELSENDIIDITFLESLGNSFKTIKFRELLELFKNHRSEIMGILPAEIGNKAIPNLITLFKDWYDSKLLFPEELINAHGKIQEYTYLLNLKRCDRDLSEKNIEYQKEINRNEEIVQRYNSILEEIEMDNLDTYPEWVDKEVGPSTFIEFLKTLEIDISLFNFEANKKETEKEIKATKENLKDKLKKIDHTIAESIIGQDHIISPITTVIKRWFIGIRSEKPIGSFFFVGPTGVGKTETAKVLASGIFDELITLDMSEYQTSIDVAKIIGIAPGYVGYEAGGGLLDKVQESPKSVILFDEIEKAHPDIFNLLLQLLDEGRLTDNKGVKVSFKECVIICTSNSNNQTIEDFQKKFNGINRNEIIDILYRSDAFKKEFLARFDDIIKYNTLDTKTLTKIFHQKLDIELNVFNDLREHIKGITIDVDEEIRNTLAKNIVNNIDPSLGAREIQRVIKEKITSPLLDIIVDRELGNKTGGYQFELVQEGNKFNWKDKKLIGDTMITLPDNIREQIIKDLSVLVVEKFKSFNNIDVDTLKVTEMFPITTERALLSISFEITSDDAEEVEADFDYFRVNEDPNENLVVGDMSFLIGDGDDSGAVWIDEEDGSQRINVWVRWWNEDE